MKNIFKRRLLYMTIGAALLAPLSCSEEFLDVPVTGQLGGPQLGSAQGINGLLIGTYAQLNGNDALGWFSGSSNWLWGSIRGGDANKGSNAGDFNTITPFVRFEADPVNPLTNDKWRGSYEGVARANAVLAALEESTELSDERKAELAAEARFLRGHYYFELKKNFNDVPWVDETVDYATGALEIPNNENIWPNIEAEFQFAMQNLPEIQTEIGRVNKWAAASYLAKTYMYQDKFAEAKTLFDDIIANGQTSGGQKYGLVDCFRDLFRWENENNQESIFAFQAASGTGSTNTANQDLAMNYPYNTGPTGPGECCGFYAPSFELAASYRTTPEGLPYLGNGYNNGEYQAPANDLVTDYGILSTAPFTPDAGPIDPRLDHTIGRRGIMFLDWQPHPGYDWIRDQGFAGPYTVKKYSYEQAEKDAGALETSGWTPGYHAINFMIIRFADVLLMAAEAEIELGNLDQALVYVNMVRERASNCILVEEDGEPVANYVISLYESWPDAETARRAVRFERKLELALEGQRFYDLLRWGVVAEAMNNYIDYESDKLVNQLGGAVFQAGQDEFLPIPQVQIDLQGSDVLQQNPGY